MIQDVKTVVSFDTTRLDNSLYVGLMSFTRDQFNTEFDEDNPAPGKIAAQLTRYEAAYTELDTAYVETRKSVYTPEIEAADAESDQLVIGIRQVAEGATRMSFDQERQQQATRFYDALKKYKIDTHENYLAEIVPTLNRELPLMLETRPSFFRARISKRWVTVLASSAWVSSAHTAGTSMEITMQITSKRLQNRLCCFMKCSSL